MTGFYMKWIAGLKRVKMFSGYFLRRNRDIRGNDSRKLTGEKELLNSTKFAKLTEFSPSMVKYTQQWPWERLNYGKINFGPKTYWKYYETRDNHPAQIVIIIIYLISVKYKKKIKLILNVTVYNWVYLHGINVQLLCRFSGNYSLTLPPTLNV